jgi:hypothetical protein
MHVNLFSYHSRRDNNLSPKYCQKILHGKCALKAGFILSF